MSWQGSMSLESPCRYLHPSQTYRNPLALSRRKRRMGLSWPCRPTSSLVPCLFLESGRQGSKLGSWPSTMMICFRECRRTFRELHPKFPEAIPTASPYNDRCLLRPRARVMQKPEGTYRSAVPSIRWIQGMNVLGLVRRGCWKPGSA